MFIFVARTLNLCYVEKGEGCYMCAEDVARVQSGNLALGLGKVKIGSSFSIN